MCVADPQLSFADPDQVPAKNIITVTDPDLKIKSKSKSKYLFLQQQ
jgi:hypothetical protein